MKKKENGFVDYPVIDPVADTIPVTIRLNPNIYLALLKVAEQNSGAIESEVTRGVGMLIIGNRLLNDPNG